MIAKQDVKILKEIFLTKDEFSKFRREFNGFKEEFYELREEFGEFNEKFTKFKDNQSTILARILKNTEDNRINRTVLSHHSAEHEDRLQVIESKLGLAAS